MGPQGFEPGQACRVQSLMDARLAACPALRVPARMIFPRRAHRSLSPVIRAALKLLRARRQRSSSAGGTTTWRDSRPTPRVRLPPLEGLSLRAHKGLNPARRAAFSPLCARSPRRGPPPASTHSAQIPQGIAGPTARTRARPGGSGSYEGVAPPLDGVWTLPDWDAARILGECSGCAWRRMRMEGVGLVSVCYDVVRRGAVVCGG